MEHSKFNAERSKTFNKHKYSQNNKGGIASKYGTDSALFIHLSCGSCILWCSTMVRWHNQFQIINMWWKIGAIIWDIIHNYQKITPKYYEEN